MNPFQRARKSNSDGTFTEYVDFGGQPLAEKDQTGDWTNYIYANGRKIARVQSQAPVLDLSGECGNCYGGSSNYIVSGLGAGVAGYVIQQGDQIVFQQKQTNARGGLYIYATDGTNSVYSLFDSAGDTINSSSVADGTWHLRTVSLNSWAGKSISTNLGVSMEANTPTGVQYDSRIADVALVTANGTVLSLFNGQSLSGSAWNGGAGSQFAMVDDSDATASTKFYLGDHLGTAQMEFASGGWPVWQGQFAPYGQELDTQTTQNHYKFTGKERDAESGNDYFGARYFASSMGRFSSPDPSGLNFADLSNPQSLNLYAYVRNNPMNSVDPNGLEDDPCGGGTVVAADGQGDGPSPCPGGGIVPPPPNPPDIDPCQGQSDDCGKQQDADFQKKNASFFAYANLLAHCTLTAPGGNYTVGSNAVDLFQPSMASALTSVFNNLNAQHITPTINSGYRTPADQTRMQNGGSGPNPAAKVSQHQAGNAVDINGTKSSNFPTIINAMQAQGLTWGGNFSHPDPPHFQLPRAGTSPSAAQVANCDATASAQ